MSSNLLATKLFAPPARLELVPRPHLIDRLDTGLLDAEGTFARKLTLVSAPAGYGKTTLVATWIHERDARYRGSHEVAWLSLDEEDDDPARFYAYLVAAIQRIGIELGPAAAAYLRSPQLPPPESLAGLLGNEIAAHAVPFILALDDYHHISQRHTHDTVGCLLEHQPPNMHLVIITREDPPFSLARLRGRGDMIEIRQADLRFTAEEGAAFLNDVMGLDLAPEEIAALEARTEGWIVGLQLAALAMRGTLQEHDNTSRFVQSFAGSSRFILDYLVEEVFRRQPKAIQTFLLQTSILDRLSGPLCAAVTGREDSQDVLQALETANLFVTPLDDRRQWYRYHHLFADLLRYRFEREGQDAGIVHGRASTWYEANGFTAEAVHHALAAEDWQRAARLVDGAGEQMLAQGQIATFLRWIQLVPDEAVVARPTLCDTAGWALALAGQLEAAERYAKQLESSAALTKASAADSLALQAYIARARHDVPRTIDLSQKALALLPPENYHARCVLEANLGVAYIYTGELATAVEVWTEAVRDARRSGNHHAEVLALSFMGQIRAARGKLHQAADLQRQAIRVGLERDASPTTARAHVNLATLLYEWDDLALAEDHLGQALELGMLAGDMHVQRDAHRIMAQVRQAQKDADGALEALGKAREFLLGDDISVSAQLATSASHVSVALAQGDTAMAMRWWERIEDLAPETASVRFDLLSNAGCYSPYPGLIQSRLLLAKGQREAAANLLAECLQVATEENFGYSQVHARLLQALAAGETAQAGNALIDALTLAQPEGFIRAFVDAGQPIAALLRKTMLSRSSMHQAYAEKLLAASVEKSPEAAADVHPSSSHPFAPNLIEPLSSRELEILHLLAQHRTNAEIARALVVSPNTVKTHLRHIYEKLGVHDRRTAVTVARELKLLP